MTNNDIFDTLSTRRETPAEMLSKMVKHFRDTRKPLELFEALKMQTRNGLGLPLLMNEHEKARPEDVERQLEAGLLDACREVGTMLIQDGKVAEGWMYLHPTGDVELARKLIAEIPIDDDNYDSMIGVLLHEGVDIGRAFQAVLDHQGTCNSITLYEQTVVQRGKGDRKAAASRLLKHLYQELTTLVRADIARREAPAEESESLFDLIDRRRWIMDEDNYHLDTTHLASTVKIASILDDPTELRMAWELCQYGRRLPAQFQYPGDEPFVDFYPAYSAFYSILLRENIDAGLKLFERKAKAVDVAKHGTGGIETYVDLLDRSGRPLQAIETAVQLVPSDIPPQRIVPMLLAIAERAKAKGEADAYDLILAYCRDHDDVIGYAATLHAASTLQV